MTEHSKPSTRLAPLAFAWAGLVVLTGVSLGLGHWIEDGRWLAPLVAALIWLKAWVVARYYLEIPLARTLLRRAVWAFVAFAPAALLLTSLLGREFAAWAQL